MNHSYGSCRSLLAAEKSLRVAPGWNRPELERVERSGDRRRAWPPERAAQEFMTRYERIWSGALADE